MRKKLLITFTVCTLMIFSMVIRAQEQTQLEAKLPLPVVSKENTFPTKSINVLGSKMAYLESGAGDVVLFVHGNPSSSYLWRNVMPYATKSHRTIAVDLIGMGNSEKPGIDYTFADHFRYLSEFIKQMGLEKFTIIGHDWGATLAWEYARQNPDKVEKLAFMEGVLPPTFPSPSFESLGPQMGKVFQSLRDPVQGQQMIMKGNMFVEQILPGLMNLPIDKDVHSVYRTPFIEETSRKPTLVWATELPIAGEPAANVKMLENITSFMGDTKMPVLMLYASPGAIMSPQAVD